MCAHGYTRFHAPRAAPRDMAALTGVHRESDIGMAGATMRGDGALVADLAASA